MEIGLKSNPSNAQNATLEVTQLQLSEVDLVRPEEHLEDSHFMESGITIGHPQ